MTTATTTKGTKTTSWAKGPPKGIKRTPVPKGHPEPIAAPRVQAASAPAGRWATAEAYAARGLTLVLAAALPVCNLLLSGLTVEAWMAAKDGWVASEHWQYQMMAVDPFLACLSGFAALAGIGVSTPHVKVGVSIIARQKELNAWLVALVIDVGLIASKLVSALRPERTEATIVLWVTVLLCIAFNAVAFMSGRNHIQN